MDLEICSGRFKAISKKKDYEYNIRRKFSYLDHSKVLKNNVSKSEIESFLEKLEPLRERMREDFVRLNNEIYLNFSSSLNNSQLIRILKINNDFFKENMEVGTYLLNLIQLINLDDLKGLENRYVVHLVIALANVSQ